MEVPRGPALLQDPVLNKDEAFTRSERDALGLHGLLPPRVSTIEEQCERVLENFEAKPSDLERYIFLIALQDRNETLFYRAIVDHIGRMMPIIYTPTVGEACRVFGHIMRRPRGLYISAEDRGRISAVLQNWSRDVSMIVVTDGERILGLGDLGANGMGIPIGKLSLYSACAGVHPSSCLPVMLDVGTENETLRDHPQYLGVRRSRLRGEAYDELVDEFVEAVRTTFPRAVLQFEDFATANAFRLLERYRDRLPAFNDDIQGTAAVAVAGVHASGRLSGRALSEEVLLFFGAGQAATGIADLAVSAMTRRGLSVEEARARCWFVDSKGLVVRSRGDLAPHKLRYAHDVNPVAGLHEAIRTVEPTALIGVSGQPGAFDEPALHSMAALNERPVVFALSNPTSRSECTAEQAYGWTDGRAIFASGSPFPPVETHGRRSVPGQGNNAYIFPGVGLGLIASGARRVSDRMFGAAARVLSESVDEAALADGLIFPPLERLREVSQRIAVEVARRAREEGTASTDGEPEELVRAIRYEPVYQSYV